MRFACIPIAVILACAGCAPARHRAPEPPAAERAKTGARIVRVDGAARFQTMDNFAASDCWSMQKIGAWSLENRNRVADLLFSREKGIGLSAWRFNIGAGICPELGAGSWRTAETFETGEGRYDWSRQGPEQWFLGAAKERGVRQFIAFANSPPARMTRNGLTFCTPESGETNLKQGYEGQYAVYLADVLEHFRRHPDPSRRVEFGWISPVNEPQWEWNYPGQEGNRVPNDTIKAIYRALDKELKQRGLSTRILGVESGSLAIPGMTGSVDMHGAKYGDYVRDFCGDPEMERIMGRLICSHSYRADLVPHSMVNARIRLRNLMDKYPGWKFWQSEYCILQGSKGQGGGGRDLGMDTALEVARVIHHDLVLLNAAAWQWWTAVSPERFKDGLIYTDYRSPGDAETVHPSKMLWALGNFSRFIRPGARRIALEGASETKGLLGSAWDDEETGCVVVVFVNMADAPETVRIEAGRVPGRTVRHWTPWLTTAAPGDDLRRGETFSAGRDHVIPPRSVVTLVGGG